MSDLPPGQAAPAAAASLPYAPWGERVLAALVDLALVLGITVVLMGILLVLTLVFAGLAAAADQASHEGAGPLSGMPCCLCCGAPFGLALVGFLFGLFNKVYLVGKRGYSIGQGFRKLRVVQADGQLVPYGTLVLRQLIVFAFSLFYILAWLDILWPLWDEKRQTLHDKAVGTFVIQSR